MSKDNWLFQEFEHISGDSRMDSRRAAFLLFDFVNMFNIDDFRVIAEDGEWQNKRIEILYKPTIDTHPEKVEDQWYEHLKEWREKH